MRNLSVLGIEIFNREYTHTSVLKYLLSVLLKGTGIKAKDIVQHTGLSVKQAQRYMYDRLGLISFNLDDVISILQLTKYTIIDLFKQVNKFISKQYKVSYIDNNKFIMHTLETFNAIEFKPETFKELLKQRHKTLYIYGYKEHGNYYDCEISKYPSELIDKVTRKSTGV